MVPEHAQTGDPGETASISENQTLSSPTPLPDLADLNPTPVDLPTLPPPVVASDEPAPTAEGALVADVGVFATMPENVATGQSAPDFSARALGQRTFELSAARGSYVLIYPTVIGCGDCVFTMSQLAAAYPDHAGANLEVVLLNLYPEDVPESWSGFVELYPELGAVWAVVDSIDFVVDYEVRSLGTMLLVDPEGRLVYRRNFPLVEDEFRELFALVSS